jgi:hypothetical protein
VGRIKQPLPVKLVVGMISGCADLFDAAEQALVVHFGPADYVSRRLPFVHTDYYAAEFGSELERRFVAFERLVDPGELARIKVLTNGLEEIWSGEGRRRINLDPGYVSQAKLVLASTKNHGHRVYVGSGIYAEVTLCYRDKDFRVMPWTYPDYASEPYLDIIREIRRNYVQQLRDLRAE